MYTVQQTTEINSEIIKIYYTGKPNKLGGTWSRDEREAKLFETEQEAEPIANIGKPTIKQKV